MSEVTEKKVRDFINIVLSACIGIVFSGSYFYIGDVKADLLADISTVKEDLTKEINEDRVVLDQHRMRYERMARETSRVLTAVEVQGENNKAIGVEMGRFNDILCELIENQERRNEIHQNRGSLSIN